MAEKKKKIKKTEEKPKPKKVKKRWVTQRELSNIYGWSPTVTKNLIADGVIKLARNKKFDFDVAAQAIGQYRPDVGGPSDIEIQATKEVDARKKSKPANLAEAKEKREKLRVEDLQMDIDLKKGILCIQVDEENKGYAAAQRAKDSLFSISDRLSSQLAAESDVHKIREILNTQFTKICNELAGGRGDEEK